MSHLVQQKLSMCFASLYIIALHIRSILINKNLHECKVHVVLKNKNQPLFLDSAVVVARYDCDRGIPSCVRMKVECIF